MKEPLLLGVAPMGECVTITFRTGLRLLWVKTHVVAWCGNEKEGPCYHTTPMSEAEHNSYTRFHTACQHTGAILEEDVLNYLLEARLTGLLRRRVQDELLELTQVYLGR